MPVDMMDALRGRANRTIAANAAILRKTPPEKQWWNLAAKKAAAERIKDEAEHEFRREHGRGNNDARDAMRHAETSRRIASQVDPVTANLGGLAVEAGGLGRGAWRFATGRPTGDVFGEMMMDLRNNAEGRAAAAAGRPVDPRNLQNAPHR